MSMETFGVLIISTIFITAVHSSQTKPDFSYQSSEEEYMKSLEWSGICKNGQQQSPVNIYQPYINHIDEVLFENYNTTFDGNIKKTKKTIHVTVNETQEVRIKLPNQNKSFKLHDIHFHINCSEHLVNNEKYYLEAHFVHYNDQFKSFQEAKNSSNQGIAVVGVLFRLEEIENPAINVLLDMLRRNSTNRGLSRKRISYRQLLPDKFEFLYQYEGSFTTPNCHENVLWNIMKEINYISKRQLLDFIKITNSSKNCRAVQNLNRRTVWQLRATVPSSSATFSLSQNKLSIFLINLFYPLYGMLMGFFRR